MRLPMFDIIDSAVALLDKRKDFYQACAYELQGLVDEILTGEALLSVSARVKQPLSMREKVLRKRLYLDFDNPYDLLSNLSDLIGLRAECRFLHDEATLHRKLVAACTIRHSDGTCSAEANPNIRFELSSPQPQLQQNGLTIYRVDGKYHKNGVCAPFELQIKALVHVFWAEVEHQLIYKNNSYMLMDSFLRELLYSNYTSLRQIDQHLQLIYEQMRATPNDPDSVRAAGFRAMVAKTLSDLFMRDMHKKLGFSVRLDGICDILAHYLIMRGADGNVPLVALMRSIRHAAECSVSFDDVLELEADYEPDDPFLSRMGARFLQLMNTDFEWNLLFRMLFTLEEGSRLDVFSKFMLFYRDSFAQPSLYAALPKSRVERASTAVLTHLSDILVRRGDLSMLSEQTVESIRQGIQNVLEADCIDRPEQARHLLRAALYDEMLA